MEKALRTMNALVSLGILVVLILILIRLPRAQHFPTIKEFTEANGDQRKNLLLKMPIVRVEKVLGTVSVDVTNYELDVSVTNTPLDVVVDD